MFVTDKQSLEDEIDFFLLSLNSLSFETPTIPINIELGNSCRVMHAGAIKQLRFANYLKSYVSTKYPNKYNINIIYYESDGLIPSVRESRGIDLPYGQDSSYIRYGFAKKNCAVRFTPYPTITQLEVFVRNIREHLFSDRFKNCLHKSDINAITENLSSIVGIHDYKHDVGSTLNIWFRMLNTKILHFCNIPPPTWYPLSSFLSDSTYLTIVSRVLCSASTTEFQTFSEFPVMLCSTPSRRVRLSYDKWNQMVLNNETNYLYPDVLLRQISSSYVAPSIRLHGRKFNYQTTIDNSKFDGYPSLRLIYNALVEPNASLNDEKNDSFISTKSIHFLYHSILGSLDTYKSLVLDTPLFFSVCHQSTTP